MSIHHDQELLKHIHEETSFLLHHTGNLTKDEFLTDEVLAAPLFEVWRLLERLLKN